ncbi:MAG: pyridoxal-phosphate dependent enzyme [Acholeplasmataceae bacterium]|nr:pyridoxal-phosphate dependent enzyme [Acholeplasmataceae bacterium]
MLKSGKTPLLRARALEKRFNIKEIWLKLEGTNPTGHKSDRIASVLVNDMVAHGQTMMVADGSLPFLRSLVSAIERKNLIIRIPRFKHERLKASRLDHNLIVDMTNEKESKAVVMKDFAKAHQAYLVREGSSHVHLSQMALEPMTEEILKKVTDVTEIYVRFSYGYTLSSVYNAFLKHWIKNDVETLPKLVCGTDAIYSGWLESVQVSDEHEDEGKLLVMDAKRALHETRGEMVGLDTEMLMEARKILKSDENIIVSKEEAHAFAAFMKQVRSGTVQNGKHVIILNDGKNRVSIDEVSSYQHLGKKELYALVEKYLGRFGDSKEEVEDAIDNAMTKGHILIAEGEDLPDGIAVIVHTGFSQFIPSYHLAYIGINPQSKGRGVGTELIMRAIDLTDGNLSLHVDLDNPGAKKLYEKMGFKHVYNRMIHK